MSIICAEIIFHNFFRHVFHKKPSIIFDENMKSRQGAHIFFMILGFQKHASPTYLQLYLHTHGYHNGVLPLGRYYSIEQKKSLIKKMFEFLINPESTWTNLQSIFQKFFCYCYNSKIIYLIIITYFCLTTDTTLNSWISR